MPMRKEINVEGNTTYARYEPDGEEPVIRGLAARSRSDASATPELGLEEGTSEGDGSSKEIGSDGDGSLEIN